MRKSYKNQSPNAKSMSNNKFIAMNKIDILGVKIDKLALSQVLDKIDQFLESDKQRYVATVNPEMIVMAQGDEEFKKILNNADISVADGAGILRAAKLNGVFLEKISGVDLIAEICAADFIRNKKIYLLGAGKGIAEKTADVLRKKYSGLNIVGAEEGIPSSISSNNKLSKLNEDLIKRINNAHPNILFVAFGAPKQEKWIVENLKKMPSVKLAMGVGGAFDFILGRVKRAPKFMQRLGLEWLWRLFVEPWRMKRIYNATVKFSWLVLKSKILKLIK